MLSQVDPLEGQRIKSPGLWTTGMALFSMFFGAGNIIFPLIVGSQAKSMAPYALVGLGLSAVLFPFLGLFAMLFCQGNLRAFLSRLGTAPAFCLLFLLQIIMGPLVVLPRLMTLMHASCKAYLPGLSLPLFSALLCAFVFLLTVKPSRIVDLLGKVLTPFLLATLAILTIAGLLNGSSQAPVIESGAHHFLEGLKGGYMTMDLISALLFATLILPHLQRGTESLGSSAAERHVRKKMVGSSIIAALLLMLTYIGLCLLASRHETLASNPPEEMLQAIVVEIMGPAGAAIAAMAVFLACLTTAISLSAVFSRYLSTEILRQKKENALPLLITLGLTAVMSNLGFSGLMKIAGPLMQILYPALIVLALHHIAFGLYRVQTVKLPVYAALGLGIAGFCLA